jgi:hypothetical protein
MAQFKPKQWDIIQCVDIFSEIKTTHWLVESMKDALSSHWKDEGLDEHLSYLIHKYDEEMRLLIQKLDTAFEKVSPSPNLYELSDTILEKVVDNLKNKDNSEFN